MAKTKSKQKSKPGNAAAAGGSAALKKAKKTKNIFKVADVKQKKKPKEVQGKLKKVNKILFFRSIGTTIFLWMSSKE